MKQHHRILLVLVISTTGNLHSSTDVGSSCFMVRDSSSPADADYLGQLQFKGDDDGGADEIYAKDNW